MLAVRPKETLSMTTRDGVRLDADVYYPDAEGPFPVLLMRQPYGRSIASAVVYAHPTWYAAQGYIVVIQDVRGRGSSEGEFKLFEAETNDGLESVNWAAALPGSTGNVGMYGFSYQGMTQLYAAATRPEALKTICPSMVGYDLYQDWAYEGGAFCYQLNLGWALQLAAETARRAKDREAYQLLYTAARTPPIQDPVCPRSALLLQLAARSHYIDWLDHPQPDAYWEQLSPQNELQTIDLPMLHIGGWFDPYLRGTLRLYRDMSDRSQFAQHLIVGPWAHLPWGRKVGSMDYGAESNSPIDALQIRWFDHFLKGKTTGLIEEPPVRLFEMGRNRWRSFDRFPAPAPTSYFLASTRLAALDDRAGSLTTDSPAASSSDTFVHDPWRPVPALGGHATIPAGAFDRAGLDCRTDVLTYTSAPLETDLSLAGEITVQLSCTTDAVSFDLCAVLSEVYADGGVYNFAQGYLRVDRAAPDDRYAIAVQPTCICIAQGNALRLSISATCFPAYPINCGTGTPATNSRLTEAQIITVTLASGGDSQSQVQLPIVAASN